MDRRYKHLNGEERGVILAEHRRGASLGAIGLLLGRSASTIGRELRRGRPEGEPAHPYCAQLGGDQYRARAPSGAGVGISWFAAIGSMTG